MQPQIVDSALQSSFDSLITENQNTSTGPESYEHYSHP